MVKNEGARKSVSVVRMGHVADYVLDLLAEILGEQPEREKRFPWALGDMSAKTGRRVQLPFDGFWARHSLVVEVDEDQHRRAVAFWDKPSVATVSGVFRGEQRAIYDARKRTAARDAGYTVLEISWERRPLPRNRDREVDRRLLARTLREAGIEAFGAATAPRASAELEDVQRLRGA